MAYKLPPLNSLRAFEAAARHLSFVKAAQELNVTQAAISHQVKALEAAVGVALFRRLPRGLAITEAGTAARPILSEAFARMEEAVDRMRSEELSGTLTVSITSSFGSWLVGRLDQFREAHPDIDLLLDASDKLADLERDPVDVAIRYGAGDYPGLSVTPLLREREFPVCSPTLMEGPHPLREPADLAHHTLLHVTNWRAYTDDWGEDDLWPNWKMWLKAAGVHTVDWRTGPRFKQSMMAMQAAREGQGVALGSTILAADDLKSGRLVRPFDVTVGAPDAFGYYFVCLERYADRPKIAAFRTWMMELLECAFDEEETPRAETPV